MVNFKTEITRIQSTSGFLKSEHFLPSDTGTYVCVLEDKKCLFFGKFGMLCILVTSVLRLFFLSYFQRFNFYTVDPYSVCKQEHTDQIKVLFGRFLSKSVELEAKH